ncbi:glycosyltransferase [Vibrio breoganii]|uniref:glycosyltransferase n=1 Tax=Vibrio breoganii TaxID=553239 RepID=UPI000C85459C|nr:glycosyltransferase [Vibrio breoganii]PMJ45292.1 hypothetical protein BCU21_13885 [Vibrio breoganii]
MKKRVLHIVGGLDVGGIEKWISNLLKVKEFHENEHYILSMHPTMDAIVPELSLAEEKILFVGKNNVLSRLSKLTEIIKDIKPDVVHSHSSYSSGLYLLVSHLLGVKKCIAHSHSDRRTVDKNATLVKRVYISVMKYILSKNFVTKLAVSNDSGKSLFKKNYEVMYCGVPILDKTIINSYVELDKAKQKGKKLVFHIGRDTPAKNFKFIYDLVDSFTSNKNIQFVFVGGGLDSVKNEFQLRGIRNINFIGQVPDPMSIMHSYGDLFILPSKWEGLPLSVVEAQLAGLPCLLSDKITSEVNIGNVSYLELNVELWKSSILEKVQTHKVVTIDSRKFSLINNIDELNNMYGD